MIIYLLEALYSTYVCIMDFFMQLTCLINGVLSEVSCSELGYWETNKRQLSLSILLHLHEERKALEFTFFYDHRNVFPVCCFILTEDQGR